ncbi:hydrolase [Mucilaginibacter xinganensis]|uniref:Hydrolase n=1 Tax=Mucilaginibacter xinganensis TaxID=1234841 RepID=A0A223NR08_9SPHI|nr:hydrolase [Mucilaginibacter xinganensis]ASU32277.1 hydrolase [Mucilaginibacter xinganensis]
MKIFNKLKYPVLAVAFAGLFLASCKKDNGYSGTSQAAIEKGNIKSAFSAVVVSEDFEVGATSPKTAYDVSPTGSSSGDNVTLHGNSWNMYDALIGNLSGDLKNGSWAGRIRNTGKITMLFDVATGISTVTIKHGTYGTDGSSTWGLWYSTNGGSSWTQTGGSITSSTTLQTQSFTINVSGNARLEIRKLTGGTNRVDIDDITINDNTTGGGGGGGTVLTGKKFLFDATKYENAGSADWQIDADGTENVPLYTGGTTVETKAQRIPTPSYTGITASTPETYWKGAASAWAVSLVKDGELVESLPVGTAITYGNTSNPQDLSNYDVYVVIEPNRLFTAAEKTAIMNFVANGGGLMMVADHTAATTAGTDANGYNPSDRDGDGYDSPRVWNDLMTNNGINNNKPFGFNVDYVDISDQPTTNVYTGTNANAQKVLNGAAGTASKLAFYNGTTATLYPAQNSTVQGLFWRTTSTNGGTTGVMALLATYGTGRVVFIGDSSDADDGTGDTGDSLFNGWSGDAPSGYTSHPAFHLNASLWLAKAQ